MINLRPYQDQACSVAVNLLKGHTDPFILCLATGAGKSIIIAEIARRLNDYILILQPSKEILEQNFAKLYHMGITHCAVYSASLNSKQISKITFATIGSIKNYDYFKHFKYVIVDECDLVNGTDKDTMYMKLFKEIKPLGICGLTATPYRLVKKFFKDDSGGGVATTGVEVMTRVYPYFFKKIAFKIELAELIEMGYLSPVKYFINKPHKEKLKLNTTGSDFTEQSIKQNTILRDPVAVKAIKYAEQNHKRTITYRSSVEAARSLTQALQAIGIHAPTVSALTPKSEREAILMKYRKGIYKHLINCGVFLIGLDVPEIDCIIWDRYTKNPRILYQAIGRGLRLDPADKNKVLSVYDLTGCMFETGRVEDFRLIKENGFKDKLVGCKINGNIYDISGIPLYAYRQ